MKEIRAGLTSMTFASVSGMRLQNNSGPVAANTAIRFRAARVSKRLFGILHRLLTVLLLINVCFGGTFTVPANAPGPWPAILSSAGHAPAKQGVADIWVAP